MLISIIVPIYNIERYILHSARSLFEQSYEQCEYIFVDDSSTDRSIELLSSFVESDYSYLSDRVKIIRHTQNRGCSQARNSGVEVARGEYILFIDGDDWVDHSMVTSLVSRAGEGGEGIDIISCGYYEVFDAKRIRYSARWIGGRTGSLHVVLTQSFAIPDTICMMLIRRTLFSECGVEFHHRLKIGEDFAMKVQLLYYARRVAYVDRPLYFYRRNVEGSATYHLGAAQRIGYIRAMFTVRDFIHERGESEKFSSSLLLMPMNVRRWLIMRRGEGLTPRGLALRILCYAVNYLYTLYIRIANLTQSS